MAKQDFYFWIPQTLTGLRIMAGPVILWALLNDKTMIAFLLALTAGLTDWLDGVSARYFRIESTFGRTFDPIADKIFIAFVCVGFIINNKIPFWLSMLILLRDLLIILGATWIQKKQIPYSLAPIRISKYNTFLQMCLIGWLLLVPLLPESRFYLFFSKILIYGTLITTLLSGCVYAKIFNKLYRSSLLLEMAPGHQHSCNDKRRHTSKS